MFECKYKFELKDSIKCAKYIYKSQRRKQDKIIAILIPILMIAMIAMLVVDIVNKKSFVWDIILLVALVVLEVFYSLMPLMIIYSQKKSFKNLKLDEMDYMHIVINDNLCTVEFIKDNESMSKQINNLKSITSYLEDNESLILIFNKIEYVCIRKKELVGDVNKLKSNIEKIMAKSSNKKSRI